MTNAVENFVMKKLAPFFQEPSPGSLYQRGQTPPTIRRLKEALRTHSFADLLPFEAFDDENTLFINSDSYGFVLELSTAVALDEKMLNVLSGIFNGDHISKDMVIQHCLYASPDVMPQLTAWANRVHEDAPDEFGEKPNRNSNIYRILARMRVDMHANANWQSMSEQTSMMSRDFRAFLTFQLPYPEGKRENVSPLMRQKMVSNRNAVQAILKTADLTSKVMDADAFVDLIDTIVNVQVKKRDPRAYDENTLIRDQVVPKDNMMLVGRDDLYIDNPRANTHVSIYGVDAYPKAWAGWQNGELIGSLFEESRRISTPFLVTMTLHIPDQLEQLSQAKMKLQRSIQMSESPIAKSIPSWFTKRDEWGFVVSKMDEGHTNIHVNYQIVLFATTETKEKAEREVEATYRGNKWKLYKQRYMLVPAFIMALPLGASQCYTNFVRRKKMFKTMPSWSVVNVAPWIAEWKGTPNPLQLLSGWRGQITNFNPWDNLEGNYNVAVAARSGAGKSVFMQDLALAVLAQGGRAWVFDRGRSFERLCHLLGNEYRTQFLVFDGSRHISLNPFTHVKVWDTDNATRHDFNLPDEVRKEATSERILIHNLLVQMVSGPTDIIPVERQTWLDIALNEVWDVKGRDAEITDVHDNLKVKGENDERYSDLADALYPFTRQGPNGHYFAGPSNIDLSDEFVVLEMKELDNREQLQTIVLLMLMMRIGQTMFSAERRGRKQVVMVDEAWKLLKYGNASTFIEEGYRTARKYGGAFVTITQGVNDFYKNPTTQACLENSDWTLLLAQKSESVKQLANSDRLPGGKDNIKLIRRLKMVKGLYSECAIISPQGLAVVRLIVDKFSEMLFTSNADEVAQLQALTANGHSLVEALSRLASQREAHRG